MERASMNGMPATAGCERPRAAPCGRRTPVGRSGGGQAPPAFPKQTAKYKMHRTPLAEPRGNAMRTSRPYDGVRILDLTHELGRYATRLFADLGAEVVRVEPPGGLPDRAGLRRGGAPGPADFAFAFFNASKKSVVLDAATPAGRRRFAR